MQLGFVGLGKMGMNMVEKLLLGGHEVVANARSADSIAKAEALGAKGAGSLALLSGALRVPRAVWLMVPAGDATTQVLEDLLPHLSSGDIVIDGGNSYYKDSVRRCEMLTSQGIGCMGCGTAGG